VAKHAVERVSWHAQHSHLLHHYLAKSSSQDQTSIQWDKKTCNLAPDQSLEAHVVWQIWKVTSLARHLTSSRHIIHATQCNVIFLVSSCETKVQSLQPHLVVRVLQNLLQSEGSIPATWVAGPLVEQPYQPGNGPCPGKDGDMALV